MKAKFLILTVLSLLSLTVKAQSINVHNPAGTYTQAGSGVNTKQKVNITAKDFVRKQMNEFIGGEVWSYSIDPETMKAKGFILNEDKWVNGATETIVWKFRDPEEGMIEYIVALFKTPAQARNFFQSFGTIGFLDKDYQGNRLTDAYVSGYMDMDFNVGIKDNYVVIGTW